MINSTILILGAIGILAVIGIGVAFYLVKNRGVIGLAKQNVLMATSDGQLLTKEFNIFKDSIISDKIMSGWLMNHMFRRWIEGTNDTCVFIDERSAIPYNAGIKNFDRKQYVDWGIAHVEGETGIAYREWMSTINRETQESNKDRMYETIKTSVLAFVLLACLVTCVVLGFNLWGGE